MHRKMTRNMACSLLSSFCYSMDTFPTTYTKWTRTLGPLKFFISFLQSKIIYLFIYLFIHSFLFICLLYLLICLSVFRIYLEELFFLPAGAYYANSLEIKTITQVFFFPLTMTAILPFTVKCSLHKIKLPLYMYYTETEARKLKLKELYI